MSESQGGCPVGRGYGGDTQNPEKPRVPSAKDLTYGSYLRVPELIGLQSPQSDPEHHDEMLFIIIHQAYELWFKLILHELAQAAHWIGQGEPLRARHFTQRISAVLRLLVDQIHILETMSPKDFLAFRDRLNPASGFQSAQFREVEFRCGLKQSEYLKFFTGRPEDRQRLEKALAEPDLGEIFTSYLNKKSGKEKGDKEKEGRDQALRRIYQNPADHLPDHLLCESLVDIDELLMLWREHHVHVVERIIGFKAGTGGSSGASYLRTTLGKRCFPWLWEVRTQLDLGDGGEARGGAP